MAYVDGFVLAVPKANIERYKDMARACEPIWREYGAIGYAECVGDDTPYGEVTSFPRSVQAKDDEIVVFSWIIYPSKEIRDACNKKVMEDPRLKAMMATDIFDAKRMIYGGFVPFIGP
jgi:uncharacterized protein YbaA (DUF1428 family)